MLVLAALLVTFPTLAEPELKGQPNELKTFLYPEKRTISIKGFAKEKAYSDKAIVNLVITTEEDKLSDALKKNSDLRTTITKTMVDAGFKLENINTSKFSTSPQYGWFGDDPDSYQIVNRMAVGIFDENQLNVLASISDSNKEIALTDTIYEHTQKEAVEQKVKAKALAKVMKQKAFYEKTLGLKLVPVSFHDFDVVKAGTRGAQALEQRIIITGSRVKRTSASKSRMGDAAIKMPQSFDEVEYVATLSVDFEVVNLNKNVE